MSRANLPSDDGVTTERRGYTRIACDVSAELRLPDGTVHTGTVRDISFGGAYLDCDQPASVAVQQRAELGDCDLRLSLSVEGQVRPAHIKCLVIESIECRVGLRFTGSNPDEYQHFRAFLLAHAEDPDALRREIQFFPNPAFPMEPAWPAFTDWLKRLFREG